jgi:predicted nucleic acid-binding protein
LKPVVFQVDSDDHKKQLALHLFDLKGLASGSPLFQSNDALIFLDTNILVWLYRINKDARSELFHIFNSLKEQNRLRIPAWVIHEYNHLVIKRDDTAFLPFKRSAKEVEKKLKTIELNSKLVIDDDYLNGSQYGGKSEFLSELDKATSSLRSLLKVLTSSRNKNIDEIQIEIEELINGCVLESDINDLLKKSSIFGSVRSKNRVPPGFLDEGKPDNEYGDYILWQEILSICRKEGKSALLITNDNKPDWVYTPRMILDRSQVIKPNNGSSDIQIDLPLPYLQNEFKSEVTDDFDFMLCNVELLSHLCSSVTFNPKDHNKYQKFAEAVSVESLKDDTYAVISWFLNNKIEYSHCIKTVAYWEYSPQQIDDEALRNYIHLNIPNIDINKVDMTEVLCELFI